MAHMAYFFQNNPYPGALNLFFNTYIGAASLWSLPREAGGSTAVEGTCIFAYSSKNSCLPPGFLELRSSQ